MTEPVKRVHWGLIGCGDISRKRVAPALRDLDCCVFEALSRADATRAQDFASEFRANSWHSDWKELVNDSGVEAVYIATPVDLHAEMTVACADAGKHVLCEKPMALSVAECDRMIDACRTNGVKLGIAYYRHFYPVIGRIKEILSSSEVGEPVMAQVNAFEYYNPGPGDPRHWFVEKARSGGGPMFDFGCHRIEVLTNLFGTVNRVVGAAGRVKFERDVEDTATAQFTFDSGPWASLSVTHATWEAQDTLHIFCTRGSLHVPVLNRGELEIKTPDGTTTESHPPDPNFHAPLIEDFTEAVLKNRRPTVAGEEGREVNRLLEKIYRP